MQLSSSIQLASRAIRLSRINNLIIIFFTQYFSAFFLLSSQQTWTELATDARFFLMVMSTTIVAASGYFINDYYDIKIDLINKPDKVIVGKEIKRRPVMFAHVILNIMGIMMGTFVSIWIGLINTVAVFLLWLYSNQLKRLPFVGNLVVALLTGAVLLTLCVYYQEATTKLWAYAFFAFGINLIREIIKDIEDIEGDASFGSLTLPIVFGVRKTKNALLIVSILFLCALVVFLFKINDQILSMYFGIWFIPFIHFIILLQRADKKRDFSLLSKYCKWIILAGILSMVIFRF